MWRSLILPTLALTCALCVGCTPARTQRARDGLCASSGCGSVKLPDSKGTECPPPTIINGPVGPPAGPGTVKPNTPPPPSAPKRLMPPADPASALVPVAPKVTPASDPAPAPAVPTVTPPPPLAPPPMRLPDFRPTEPFEPKSLEVLPPAPVFEKRGEVPAPPAVVPANLEQSGPRLSPVVTADLKGMRKQPVTVPAAPPAHAAEPAKSPDLVRLELEMKRSMEMDDAAARPRPIPVTTARRAVPTGPASYGHANDYGNLTGRIYQWRHQWRLRYAAVDADDPHGGSVLLLGGTALDCVQDGQAVRVFGSLLPADQHGNVSYQVQKVEILD